MSVGVLRDARPEAAVGLEEEEARPVGVDEPGRRGDDELEERLQLPHARHRLRDLEERAEVLEPLLDRRRHGRRATCYFRPPGVSTR